MGNNREDELLVLVPLDGSGIGNTRLLRLLRDRQWSEDEFWEVRNRLIDRGVLEVGRGRGGSVRRVLVTADRLASEAPPDSVELVPKSNGDVKPPSELELYPDIARVLEEKWVKDKRVESAIVQNTALQGRKATGGKWTRPDLTVATLSTYPYVPGRHFDVITFEVKPCDGIDVTAVYEALAHLRSATKAYVLLHIPDTHTDELEETRLEICAEAKKHGIGVIIMSNPADYETWDEQVDPVRRDPDPKKLNDFLAKQFTQEQLEKIVRWFR